MIRHQLRRLGVLAATVVALATYVGVTSSQASSPASSSTSGSPASPGGALPAGTFGCFGQPCTRDFVTTHNRLVRLYVEIQTFEDQGNQRAVGWVGCFNGSNPRQPTNCSAIKRAQPSITLDDRAAGGPISNCGAGFPPCSSIQGYATGTVPCLAGRWSARIGAASVVIATDTVTNPFATTPTFVGPLC